jgi:hypothetical protein
VTDPKLKAIETDLLDRLRHMFFAFRSSYARLTDKSDIWLRVESIDNEDPSQPDASLIEAYRTMRPFCERLLEEWDRSADKEKLTREDFLRIQRAIETLDTVSTASHTGQIFAALINLLELMLWT